MDEILHMILVKLRKSNVLFPWTQTAHYIHSSLNILHLLEADFVFPKVLLLLFISIVTNTACDVLLCPCKPQILLFIFFI